MLYPFCFRLQGKSEDKLLSICTKYRRFIAQYFADPQLNPEHKYIDIPSTYGLIYMLMYIAAARRDSYRDSSWARYHFHCLITFQFVSNIGYCHLLLPGQPPN